jgi:hypothetical protein
MDSMRATISLGVALAVVLGASSTAAQGTFEGMAVYKMSMSNGKSGEIKFYQQGTRVRQEFASEGHSFASIYDGATGDMMWLIPERKQYMVFNMKTASEQMKGMAGAMTGGDKSDYSADLAKTKVTPTGLRETVAGVPCEHYLFTKTDDPDAGKLDICGAKGLGLLGLDDKSNFGLPSTRALLASQNPELAKLAKDGFYPLKMTGVDKEGKKFSMEATQLQRGHVDAALFSPPPGYSKLDMSAIAGAGRKP